jgi:GPI mannosyltransferase 4
MILSNTVIFQKEYLEKKYDEAKKEEKTGDMVRYFKMRMTLPNHSYSKCAILSTLCVIGIFNRPTFLLFGLPIIFHWMIRGFGTQSVSFVDFNIRMLFFILSGLPALCIIVIIDSLYYGYLSLAQIYIMDININSFLVTPVNFIRYNINPENTAQHGEHPKWLHLLVNIPLLYNILGVIAVFSFGSMFYKFCKNEFQNLPQTQSFVSLMTSAVFVPVLLLSLFNHQEPRFLIPVTTPLIMLHAPKLILGVNFSSYLSESQWNVIKCLSKCCEINKINISGRFILKVWYSMNILFTLFFGFIHQAGVVQLAEHFSKYHQTQPLSSQIHICTSHIYNIPESLLILPHSSVLYTNLQTGRKYKVARRLFIHEYGSTNLDEMFNKTKRLIEVRKKSKEIQSEVFIAIPTSKAFDLNHIFNKHHSLFTFKEEKIFYPHLSTEAFPNFHHLLHPCESSEIDANDPYEKCGIESGDDGEEEFFSTASFSRKFTSVAQQFGLVVYKIEVKRKMKDEGVKNTLAW